MTRPSRSRPRMQSVRRTRRACRQRGISPLVGTVVLLAITVCLVGVIAVGFTAWSVDSSPTAAFDLAADGDAAAIVIEHVAGEPVDVRDLSLTISIDGTALSSQPSVPFTGNPGYYGAPIGPFNGAADPQWRAGERAGLTVAKTNSPTLEAGDAVAVRIAVDGRVVADLEAEAT